MCDQESDCGGKKCPFGFGSGGGYRGMTTMGGGDHDSGHGGCPYGFGKKSHHGGRGGREGHCPFLQGGGGQSHGQFGHGHHGYGGHGYDHHGMPQCPWMVARMHACPWAWGVGPGQHGGAAQGCKTNKGDFSVSLKVREYCPKDLEVKVVGTEVVVHGKHESRPEPGSAGGTVSKEFTRRIPLDDAIDPDTVTASLSSQDLTITAKKKVPEGEPRVVPIDVVGGSGDQ